MPREAGPPEEYDPVAEANALALAAFYDEGSDGPVPSYAEEQLTAIKERRREESSGRGEEESLE